MGQLKYKNYIGSVEYSEDDNILFGKVQGIRGVISYEGNSLSELETDFKNAVDDYLTICREKGIEPQKSFSGSFSIRISPLTHAKLAELAGDAGQSINAYVRNIIEKDVAVSH
ncbi:type II toxin-antitoxin system HicB family antitoxin [Petrimonas sp.]|uniref:type II toxin-antitoxin system HicB family antitoxin n=1 Tax=Petrimonas sp. TaxID=2023866 RepID=UPI003F5145B8